MTRTNAGGQDHLESHRSGQQPIRLRLRITSEDAEWLTQMSSMIYRMRPSAPVLEAALAFLYANSDNTAPKPKEVFRAIANCQARVTELRQRIDALKTRREF